MTADGEDVARELRGREVEFARQMRERRMAKGWSQTELAKTLASQGLKFHQTTVARIEDGERPLKFVEALTIASVLGLDLSELVPSPEPMTRFDQAFNSVLERLPEAEAALISVATYLNIVAKLFDEHPELLSKMEFPAGRPKSTAEYLEMLADGFRTNRKSHWHLTTDAQTRERIVEVLTAFAGSVISSGGDDAET